jgi:rhodanese-related sulfurtransferase
MIDVPTYDATQAKEYFEKKLAFTTGPVEVSQQIEVGENIVIIDVREPEDYRKGHVPGALNLPKPEWPTANGLRRDAMNIIYCYSQTCHLGAQAAARFAAEGYQVMEMDGGFETWEAKNLQIEK